MTLEMTAHRTVKVEHLSTGRVLERQPADARELIASGDYAFCSPATPSLLDQLRTRSHAELEQLAIQTRGLVHTKRTTQELVEALLPHAESGLISLT